MSLKDLAVATVVLFAAAPSAAFAQEAAPPTEDPVWAHFGAHDYSDEQVDAFADAAGAAAAVDEQWRPQIAAAADVDVAHELATQSQTEMVAAVEETGVTVEDYNAIYTHAQTDPALADRIMAALQKNGPETQSPAAELLLSAAEGR